jgi:hypothetical protein
LRCRWIEESLHFAAATVKPESSSRQVPVEKRQGSPYGTHIRWRGVILQSQDALSANCPPVFLWQREGFREHAVALSLLMGEVVGD